MVTSGLISSLMLKCPYALRISMLIVKFACNRFNQIPNLCHQMCVIIDSDKSSINFDAFEKNISIVNCYTDVELRKE